MPIQFADVNGTRRTGERVNNLNAVVDNIGSSYYVYASTSPVFFGNPRPATPTDLGNCNLKVCAANLEYYLPYNYTGTYGAANAAQAEQQHTKIIAALKAIDADIYGLIEIEEGQNALTKLVNSLNIAVPGRYAFIDDGGLPDGTYIKVGYIYRTDKVTPYLNLKENTGTSSSKYRKKAQAFTLNSNNERFIFSLNHFKAKSGCPSSGVDADQGDGQGCYNASRVAEATSTLSFVSDWENYYNDNDVLIMGDLNAYGKEDPVQTLVRDGYIDMHRAFHADSAYSYMYNGAAGYLDNVLASPSMRSQITGVSVFHVNADEPTMFEYSGSAYQPDMYRYSDHDPVVVGLLLGGTNGLNDLSVADKIKILPNVVSDNFVVSNAEGATVQLYSVSGVLLKQEKVTSDEYAVDIKNLHLPSGIYLAKVSGKVVRLVVMKNQ
jgi:predicted extracellular nuclease